MRRILFKNRNIQTGYCNYSRLTYFEEKCVNRILIVGLNVSFLGAKNDTFKKITHLALTINSHEGKLKFYSAKLTFQTGYCIELFDL